MQLTTSINSLDRIQQKLTMMSKSAARTGNSSIRSQLSSAFSRIPGLDFLAAEHGRTLSGNPGSAYDEFLNMSSKLQWAGDNIRNLATAVYEQDEMLAQSIERSYDGDGGERQYFFTAAEPEDKTSPVAITSPMIGFIPDIKVLMGLLNGTVDSAAIHDAALWDELGQAALQISNDLDDVAADLEANNYGDAISGGAHKLRSFALTGRTLHANTKIMNTSINNLLTSLGSARANTQAVLATLAVTQDPVMKKSTEQAYLQIFPPHLSTALQSAVPRLLGLSIPMPSASGGENNAQTQGHAGSQAEQARAAMTLPSHLQRTLAEYGNSPAQFANSDNEVARLASVGGNNIATTAAAAQTAHTTASPGAALPPAPSIGTASNTLASNIGSAPAATGFGGTPTALAPLNHLAASPANNRGGAPTTVAPFGALGSPTAQGLANTSSPSAATTSRQARTGFPHSGSLHSGYSQSGQLGQIGRPGQSGNLSAGSNVAGGSTSRTGMGGALPRLGGGIAGGLSGTGAASPVANPVGTSSPSPNSHQGGANSTGTHPHSQGNAAHSAKSGGSHMGRSMMPMMAPMGQSQGQKEKKAARAKAITSAIEREGNQKALLGERRPVIPGVIGDWVRD